MDIDQSRFAYLTRTVLDGIASEDEASELRQALTERPELALEVLDELTIDALLKWQSGSIIEGTPPIDAPSVEQSTTDTLPIANRESPATVSGQPSPTRLWPPFLAAALLLMTAVASWTLSGNQTTTPPLADPLIADVVHSNGVLWSDDTTALVGEGAVCRGLLKSEGGEYTLQFRDGSKVEVSGPATLDIQSRMLVLLERGRVTADVPFSDIGFTITTPHVDVIDQGTQFGISTEHGRTDVVVFDGKVDVQSKLDLNRKQQRLSSGDAIKVDRLGKIDRLVDVRRDVDGRWWSGDQSLGDDHLVTRVYDNIGSSDERNKDRYEDAYKDTYIGYQTVAGGLHEEALAYTDNPNHEWNGLTPDGIPGFLRGADYIKTFNDYRYMEYFQMTVELSGPADLFVLADNRIPPPEWLTAGFEDTRVDIGLDEGPWLDNVDPEYQAYDVNTTAVGPGESIDNVFSVWRRRCPEGGPVVLGHAGVLGAEGNQGRAMYGVAVTPLRHEDFQDTALDK